MTTYSDAIKAMQTFFKDNWDAATPIIWGEDDPATPPNEQSWVRFNINHNDGGQASIGAPTANRFRHIGIITLQIFQPEGGYGLGARNLANTILELYQGTEDSGIVYYNVRADEIGNDDFGWYQINILVEFRYDNIT